MWILYAWAGNYSIKCLKEILCSVWNFLPNIQTPTQANSCVVAAETSFWIGKSSIGISKHGGKLNLIIFLF